MSEQLSSLISNYISDNKTVDKEFVEQAFKIILSYYKINDIKVNVQEQSIQNICNNNLMYATKYYYTDEIFIYTEDMKKILIGEYTIWLDMIKDKLPTHMRLKDTNSLLHYECLLSAIRILIYQAQCIKQFKEYSNNNSLESVLCDLSSKIDIRYAYLRGKIIGENMINSDNVFKNININNYEEIYFKYKQLNETYRSLLNFQKSNFIEPNMRFANINSLDAIEEIIYTIKICDRFKTLLLYINKVYKLNYLFMSCYSPLPLLLNPIGRYSKMMQSMDEFYTENLSGEEISNIINKASEECNLVDRIHYGLGITQNEYDQISKGKIKIL